MNLMHIRIKDFRGFSGEHDFDITSGVNYFVGPNNCGKSNLVRTLELALEPGAMAILPNTIKPGHAKPLVWLAEEINARIDKIEKASAAAPAYTKPSAAS